jgi:predicted PurR-regulated permease PerM
MPVVQRWREFRRAQRAALRASNQPWQADEDSPSMTALLAEVLTPSRHDKDDAAGTSPTEPVPDADAPADEAAEATIDSAAAAGGTSAAHPFGRAGRPLNRQSPFYMGFVGAIGVLAALLLWHTVGRLTTVLTLVVVAFFLTLALNPLVEFLTRSGIRRPGAVAIVFAGVVGIFTLLGLLVVPPVVNQGTALVQKAPEWVNQVLNTRLVQDLDRHYHLVDKIQGELNNRITDGSFISQVFGGVLGVGAAVIGGIFQTFTVLVLTLFLLASFPRVKQAAYAVVPASRRPRVISLSEEIMRRTGSYAIGQVAVATINAFCSWIMMTIVGIDYAAVLAVAVGFLGLIPMVGASIGASLVVLVAVFDEPRKAIIAVIYYVVYQQIENYVVSPRIMQRTVSVPGGVTVVAALAGGTLLGILGALLAIPVAAGLLLLYEEVLLPRQRRH